MALYKNLLHCIDCENNTSLLTSVDSGEANIKIVTTSHIKPSKFV